MTPLANPVSPAEKRYNVAHSSSRMVIERTFGVLKRRFPCLDEMRFSPERSSVVVVACAVLHNLAMRRNDLLDDEGPQPDQNVPMDQVDDEGPAEGRANAQGAAKRRGIIADYFAQIVSKIVLPHLVDASSCTVDPLFDFRCHCFPEIFRQSSPTRPSSCGRSSGRSSCSPQSQ